MAKNESSLLLSILSLIILANHVQSRFLISDTSTTSGLVSDGIQNLSSSSNILLRSLSSTDSCDETYGFLPCTSTALGNVFLILVYGYLMFVGAKLLSDGSEILLQIIGPGIIGGLFLPILSALPDATIILASGLSGSTETAQSQVSVGMGLLAGSTVMLLTLLWGSCVVVGKCDLVDSVAVDLKDTKGFSLMESGVTTDLWTTYAAKIMIVSVIPFIIVQIPDILNSSSGSQIAVLVALIVAIILLITYCLFQIFQPRFQKRRLAYAKHKHLMSGILKYLKMHSVGKFLREDGEPNLEVIENLFRSIDEDSDGYLSAKDLKTLMMGIRFQEMDMEMADAVAMVMEDFDTSGDASIEKNEFIKGISKWVNKAKRSAMFAHGRGSLSVTILNEFEAKTRREENLMADQPDENVEKIENPKWNATKAVLMLLLGTLIAAVVADPLVDAVDNFSTATSIPSFFVSFVVLPFASSSEIVTDLIFAGRKKLRTASLTFSEIYGSVTMGNVLSLAVFLALVYFRELSWDFSSEVLIIIIVCILMGAFASWRTTFPLWTSLVAYALYPLSLALVYVLNYVCGWS
ncbi:EF-hand domain [Dillenia turbinata]|uniref:EF-hand domain n=1 Tax=Dillenia turbinata TaxID=194707 RepID=A0AAN8UU17_9MAGN